MLWMLSIKLLTCRWDSDDPPLLLDRQLQILHYKWLPGWKFSILMINVVFLLRSPSSRYRLPKVKAYSRDSELDIFEL